MIAYLEKVGKTNIKNQMMIMLAVLAVVGVFQQGIRHSLPQVLIAVLVAVALDFLIVYIKSKKFFFSTSAAISGLIIALVLSPGIKWYIPLAAALVAIGSKHLIRLKGRHVFNPANFGLLFSMFIFKAYLVWWGSSVMWLVVLLGAFIAYRFKRFHLILSFLIAQSFLMALYFLLKGLPVSNAILMTNLFFAFVMLVEPKTSPSTRNGRVVYGIGAGLLSSTFIILLPAYDPSVFGLAISNIFVPVINKYTRRRD